MAASPMNIGLSLISFFPLITDNNNNNMQQQ